MATRTIAVLNQKGGVGKTTTCVNLGAALARLGRRVLLVDMDPQANMTVHVGLEPHDLSKTTYSLLLGRHDLAAAVHETSTPGLLVAPSTLALANAEIQLASTVGRELVLKEALSEWLNDSDSPMPTFGPGGMSVPGMRSSGGLGGAGGFATGSASEADAGGGESEIERGADFVIIDCPPSLGTLTMNALCCADEILLPIQTEFFALQGVAGILESVKAVQRLNRGLRLSMVVPSMVDRRTTLARDVIAEVREYFGPVVTRSEIRKNVKLAEAPSHGLTIFEYESRCNGARDYMRLAREVLGLPTDEESIDEDLRAIAAANSAARNPESEAPAAVEPEAPVVTDPVIEPDVETVVEPAAESVVEQVPAHAEMDLTEPDLTEPDHTEPDHTESVHPATLQPEPATAEAAKEPQDSAESTDGAWIRVPDAIAEERAAMEAAESVAETSVETPPANPPNVMQPLPAAPIDRLPAEVAPVPEADHAAAAPASTEENLAPAPATPSASSTPAGRFGAVEVERDPRGSRASRTRARPVRRPRRQRRARSARSTGCPRSCATTARRRAPPRRPPRPTPPNAIPGTSTRPHSDRRPCFADCALRIGLARVLHRIVETGTGGAAARSEAAGLCDVKARRRRPGQLRSSRCAHPQGRPRCGESAQLSPIG